MNPLYFDGSIRWTKQQYYDILYTERSISMVSRSNLWTVIVIIHF
jgi:hypothetical protein